MTTMKAAVIYEAGGPEVLKIESRLVPVSPEGESADSVKAFGLDRSEVLRGRGIRRACSFRGYWGLRRRG
jgi:hypothetical protein